MRLTGVSLLLRRTGKAPPVIAALDHLPCEGRLSRGRSPRKKAPLTGELAEPARPEGLCPLALTYSLYFLITKHGSGAVCAQFANSQTSTVYCVSGRALKNASAACFSASPMTFPL